MNNKELLQMLITRMLSTPYLWGGNSPLQGLDCSGLVCELLRSIGLIGREDLRAQALYDRFKIEGSPGAAFGALAFFGKSVSEITHVTFMLNAGVMVEAGGGGSQTTSLQKAIEQNAYVRVRPLKSRKDFIASVIPHGI